MDSSAPPPFLHHQTHQQQNHATRASNFIPLIVLSIIAAAILLVGLLLLLILRRGKAAGKSCSSIGSSFRKSSFDERKQVSRCSSNVKFNGIGYSPGECLLRFYILYNLVLIFKVFFVLEKDVRSCIYGGKLGFAPQFWRKRGQVFTYRELELATDGFSERNVIGNGGFSVVYKGVLSDGTVAAIKLLHVEGKQGEREFRMEVDLLSRLHSNYLVGLVGYCADQQHRLLVFEYMPNTCLQQHLHPTTSQAGKPFTLLDWRTRLRIALDCARGLDFLHEHSIPAVIHRDFKCSNILLDHSFGAKISDFGMAKTCCDKVNGQMQSRVLLPASGYVAPEYASTGKLTTKSDVYSYGVVLLELLTGRVPVDTTRPQGEHALVSWALPRLTNREKVVEMVDPALQGKYSKKELIQVAAIAAVCVQSEADYRPLITDVVQSLIPLVKIPKATCAATPARSKDGQVAIMMP